jgi:hypothetical protein
MSKLKISLKLLAVMLASSAISEATIDIQTSYVGNAGIT